jgi:hypothetical protein
MNDLIIFFNTGWMTFYEGIKNDRITGGGKHVDKEGWGVEMFNFKAFENNLYGYVQPKIDKKNNNPSTVKLEKIGALKTDQKLMNVTVVWTARRPGNGGTYIIGWYKKATVFRHSQSPPKRSNRKYKNNPLDYYATTKSKNATLLPVDERIVRVRRKEKNWMGQSNVWYADKNPTFVKVVKEYIFNGLFPPQPAIPKKGIGTGNPRQPDPLKRIEVEKSAIHTVINHYRKLGYLVESFEKDNLGWDLTATYDVIALKLEVKGLSGNIVSTELTPNEYKNIHLHKMSYRLCIVTNALKNPVLKIFSYSKDSNRWTSEDGTILKFQEVKSARIYVLQKNPPSIAEACIKNLKRTI